MSESAAKVRVAFETLGCRSNFADTVDLQALAAAQGALPCSFSEPADVYVINTCTITDAADKEAFKLIRRAKKLSPDARIVITGCLAEVGREKLAATGLIDAVVGPGKKSEALDAIFERVSAPAGGEGLVALPGKKRNLRGRITLDGAFPAEMAGPGEQLGSLALRARYHLRVQDGCDNACTFCVVPIARGGFTSRPVKDVLEDIRRLNDLGYHEVVLSGTHLGGYGLDSGNSLCELLDAILNETDVYRLRLSSLDPNEVGDELVGLIARSGRICEHLHVCVQALSDRILKLMNRRYDMAEVSSRLGFARTSLPGCCIGSDLISGFPGETRDEVERQIEVFQELPLDYLHVFPFSERSGTAAVRLKDGVEEAERKRRAARWRALGERRRAAFYRGLLGKQLEIIVESVDNASVCGTSREYAYARYPLESLSATNVDQVPSIGAPVFLHAVRYDEVSGDLLCELSSLESSA